MPPVPPSVTVTQVPGQLQVRADWTVDRNWIPVTVPPRTTPLAVTAIEVRLYASSGASGNAVATAHPSPSASSHVFTQANPGFAPGQRVLADMTVTYEDGTKVTSTSSLPVTLTGSVPAGTLPPVAVLGFVESLASLTSASPGAARLTGQVAAMAAKWRSEHLYAEATSVLGAASAIEAQIAQLQQLDLTKVAAAEVVTMPVLQQVVNDLQATIANAASIPLPDLAATTATLGQAVQQLVMLQRIVDWLARTDILDFWYDLFGAVIDDVAHVSLDLPATKQYLRTAFGNRLGNAIPNLVEDVQEEILRGFDATAGQLRAKLADAVGGVSKKTAEMYAAFDSPLLAATPTGNLTPPGAGDVLDPVPFQQELDRLSAKVDEQVRNIRAELVKSLDSLRPASAVDLFVVVMVTYVVLPILAFLVIALAGGPVSAGLLAAAVLVAGQELIHLVVRWLAGPIADQVDKLVTQVDLARQKLQETIAGSLATLTAAFSTTNVTERRLDLVSLALRELSNLAPDAFLHGVADLLGRERDALLRQATELALAAEGAMGRENGTVFDVVKPAYDQLSADRLPSAPQLPGGTGATRRAADVLLTDLAKLRAQRLELPDGKESLLTERISLFDLLRSTVPDPLDPQAAVTAAPLARLLQGHPVAIALDEASVLDSKHPGAYRALVDDIRVVAQVAGTVGPALQVPVTITRLAESRVRVKKPGGAPAGLVEQALLDLFSPAVCERAYRAAIAAAAKHPQKTSLRNFLGFTLYQEVRTRAATADLPDVSLMAFDLEVAVWKLGFPSGIDPATPKIDESLAGQLLVVGFENLAAAFNQPSRRGRLPDLPANLGGGAGANPSAADVSQWSANLSRELLQRRYQLSSGLTALRKWGRQTRLEEVPDPQLRELGFYDLVRTGEQDTRHVQLAAPLTAVLAPVTLLTAPATSGSVPPEQCRPFENTGLGGTYVIQLPAAAGDTTGLYADTATTRLTDLVLEVDLRVCHDPDLEAALAVRQRRASLLEGLIESGGRGPVLVPREQTVTELARSHRRTVRISLRGQRDAALAAWKTARQAWAQRDPGDFPASEGLTVAAVEALQPLSLYDPLALLDPAATTMTLEFAADAVTTLTALAGRFVLDPAMLGVDAELLTGLATAQSTAVLHAVGYAVVPTRAAPPIGPADGEVRVGEALRKLLPGGQVHPLRGLRMTSAEADVNQAGQTVPLAALFAPNADAKLTFDFKSLLANKAVHDVVVALTYSGAAATVTPARGARL